MRRTWHNIPRLLSFCLSLYMSLSICQYISVHKSPFLYLCLYLSFFQFLSVHVISLFLCVSLPPLVSQSMSIQVCLCISVSVLLPCVSPSVSLPLCLNPCQFKSVSLSGSLPCLSPSVSLPPCLFVNSSRSLSLFLPSPPIHCPPFFFFFVVFLCVSIFGFSSFYLF